MNKKLLMVTLMVSLLSLTAKAQMKPNLQCVANAGQVAMAAEQRRNPNDQIALRTVKYLDQNGSISPGAGRYLVYLERRASGPTVWLALLNSDCQVLRITPEHALAALQLEPDSNGNCRPPLNPLSCCRPTGCK